MSGNNYNSYGKAATFNFRCLIVVLNSEKYLQNINNSYKITKNE